MGRRENVLFDEERCAVMRRMLEGETRMAGLLPALHGRRIVGVIVEEPEVDAPAEDTTPGDDGPAPEVPAAKPKKTGKR